MTLELFTKLNLKGHFLGCGSAAQPHFCRCHVAISYEKSHLFIDVKVGKQFGNISKSCGQHVAMLYQH